MSKRKKSLVDSGRQAISDNVKAVKSAHHHWSMLVEKLAFLLGVAGFLAILFFGGLLLWYTLAPDSAPAIVAHNKLSSCLIVSVFAASFMGWLMVNEGQEWLKKRTGKAIALVVFLVLPLVCLISTVFPAWVADKTGLPTIESDRLHPFWLFVRFYPLVMTCICFFIAFRREAVPRKYFKTRRALKFAMLAAPYVAVMVFQEMNMKAELLGEGLSHTLGAAGLNFQLILAVMTSSRYE